MEIPFHVCDTISMKKADTLGEFIKSRRKSLGFTQEGFAKFITVTPRSMTTWETGAGIPDRDSIHLLAQGLQVDPSEIFAYIPSNPDLELAVNEGLATASGPLPGDPDQRDRAIQIFEQLSRRPRVLDHWLRFGESLIAAIDDIS